MIYLDTSVLVAYYCPEAMSEPVQKLLNEHTEPALSFLTQAELTSAVAQKARSGELSKTDGNRILAKFTSRGEPSTRLGQRYRGFAPNEHEGF